LIEHKTTKEVVASPRKGHEDQLELEVLVELTELLQDLLLELLLGFMSHLLIPMGLSASQQLHLLISVHNPLKTMMSTLESRGADELLRENLNQTHSRVLTAFIYG